MSEEEAKELAGLAGGRAVQSGGGVWTVELPAAGGGILILSPHGWLVQDPATGDPLAESV